jgi:hypothetical protein
VNLNLFLAAAWGVIGVGILLLWPSVEQNPQVGLEPERRFMLGGVALALTGYNIVRWRFSRQQRWTNEETRPPVRPHRSDEPPNPDFDFGDDKDRREKS